MTERADGYATGPVTPPSSGRVRTGESLAELRDRLERLVNSWEQAEPRAIAFELDRLGRHAIRTYLRQDLTTPEAANRDDVETEFVRVRYRNGVENIEELTPECRRALGITEADVVSESQLVVDPTTQTGRFVMAASDALD